jgi:hypothetical protein
MRDLHPKHAPNNARDNCGNANNRPRGLSSMVLARAESRLSRASSKEIRYTTGGFGERQPSWKAVGRSAAREPSSSLSPANSSRRQRGILYARAAERMIRATGAPHNGHRYSRPSQLVSCSAVRCDQIVEGLDLPVEHFDVFLPPAPGAFRYRLASLHRLVKLIGGTTNLVGPSAWPILTCICPANGAA